MTPSQAISVNDQQDVQAENASCSTGNLHTDFYDLIGMMALERKQQRNQAIANTEG